MPDQEIMMIKETLTDIQTGVARIETMLEAQAGTVKDHESRIRELEGKSGKKWDSVTISVITSIIVGVVGFIIGKLF